MSTNHEAFGDLPMDPDLTVMDEPVGAPGGHVSHRRWDIALVIAAGGAIGGGMRWLLNQALPHTDSGFPWSTRFLEVVAN